MGNIQCLCFHCILFVLISTYGHGNILPRLLSNLLDRIKKNLKAKAAIAKHQPFSTQNQPVHTEKTNLLFTSYSKKNVARPGQTIFFLMS